MVKRGALPFRTPYLVAAIDANHGGRLALARRLVALAAGAGADAVKFSIGGRASTPALAPAAWREIRRETRGRVHLILAPHDLDSFLVARRAGPDLYQIDPPALADGKLVRTIARERQPVLVVAGACTAATLRSAMRGLGRCPIVVLHTVAAAPLAPARARLRYIQWLATRFRQPVGYLGSEPGVGWAFVAVSLGASVIEKPFTVDRALPGVTHLCATDPGELRQIAQGLRDLTLALRPVGDRRILGEELPAVEHEGRSLVARRSMRRGQTLRTEDLDSRPASGGISARLSAWIDGRRLKYDVEIGEPITFGMIDFE